MDLASFFLKTTRRASPGGRAGRRHLPDDRRRACSTRGKVVFAETCARCHSSKLPAMVQALDPDGCAGKDYLGCWNNYWAGTQTPEFKRQMRDIVTAPDFLQRQLPLGRIQGAGHAAANQRVQPARHQRARRQHLGQLLVAVVQGSAVGRRHHVYHPFTGEARTYTDACRRPRLHPAAVARQPVVHGAIPAQQHDGAFRGEPVGRRAPALVQRFDSQDALAGRTATRIRCSAPRSPASSIASAIGLPPATASSRSI